MYIYFRLLIGTAIYNGNIKVPCGMYPETRKVRDFDSVSLSTSPFLRSPRSRRANVQTIDRLGIDSSEDNENRIRCNSFTH